MSGRGYSDDRRDDRGGYGEKGGDRRGYDRQDRGRGDRDPGYGNDSNRGYRGDSNGRGDERNFSRGDRRGDDRDYGRDDRRDDRRDFGRDDGRNYGRDDRRDDRRDFGRDDGRGDRRDSNRGDRRDSNRGGGRGRGEPRGGGRGGPPRPVVRQESPQELPKVPQQQIAKRPDKGCGGKNRREVFANFVRVYVPEHMRVHKYDMQFFLLKNRQEVPMKKTEDISRVFWKMIGEGPALGDNRIVFDDKTTCWSLEDIPFPFTRTQDGTRIWKETAPPSRGPPRFQPALAMIRFVHREIYSYPEMAHLEEAIDSMRRLLDSMATQAARYPNRDEESARDAHYATIGRAIFARNPYQDNYARNLSVNLLRGLECWTGLSISIKMNGGLGIFCNVDVKNSIVVGPARRLTDEMIAISCAKSVEISPSTEAQKDAFLTENGMSSTFRKVMDQIFKGVRCVEMRNNRKFEYNGLTSQGADKTLFQLVRDGKPIILSVAEYYEKHLQAKLRYPHLPCVMSSKKSNGALYPLEWVGTLDTLIHPYNKPLKQDDRHLMLQGTSDLPNRRKKLIDQLAFNPPGENPQQPPIFRKNDPYCEKFGVEFGREFIRLPSLVLPALELDFESDPSIKQAEIATGMWDLKLPNGEFRKVPESQRRKIITAVIWFLDPRHDFASTEEMNVLDRHNQNEPHGPNNSRMATIFKTFEAFGHTWGGQKMFGNRVYHQKNLPDGRPRPNDVSLHQDLDEFIMDFKRGVKRNFPDYTPLILAIFAEKCSTIKGYANDYCTFKQACDVAYGVHCQGITQKVFKKITGNPLTCATSFLLSLKNDAETWSRVLPRQWKGSQKLGENHGRK
ncbi:unnamed protein product [Caenorhabditis auriculariae]|uniref:PAZ domain-containing protein n=1 Tax=Caenorhabditis auriculariae TaxID=2777116 RepID=A0A8S1HVS1_9PELO|nr:unnamed protein product [Caenorhabditis auriculariae]